MRKLELISKYEHRLTLKNYSENTLKAYLNGLTIFCLNRGLCGL